MGEMQLSSFCPPWHMGTQNRKPLHIRVSTGRPHCQMDITPGAVARASLSGHP